MKEDAPSDIDVTADRTPASASSIRLRLLDVAACAALLIVAAKLRAAGLGASSLWLDDAWQALVARIHDPADMHYLEGMAAGFAWMLRGWLALTGFSEFSAQALPFVAGAILAPLAYLAASRNGMSRPVALFVGLVLAAAPEHATFSSRVKPYAFDALAALGLVWAALAILRRGAHRTAPAALATGAAAALALSAATAPVGGAAVLATAFSQLRRARRFGATVALLAFGVFAAGWWWTMLRHRMSGNLLNYWAQQMISGRTPAEWFGSACKALVAMSAGFFVGPPLLWLAALALCTAAVASRSIDRFVLLAAPLVSAVLLSSLGLAPLGGGRTDIYLLVPVAFLLATGLEAIASVVPAGIGTLLRAAIVAVGCACVAWSPGSRPYPAEDVRPLVETIERDRSAGDVVLVYALTRYAYALYGRSEFTLFAQSDGFGVRFADPAIRVLGSHRNDPTLFRPEVAAATAGATSVWFVASHLAADVLGVGDALERAGFTRVETQERDGAESSLWSRLAK